MSLEEDAARDESEELAYRREIRDFLEQIRVETASIAVVVVFMLLVMVDLILQDVASWDMFFLYVDFVFLCFFVVEHAIRFYAYGFPYLCVAAPSHHIPTGLSAL